MKNNLIDGMSPEQALKILKRLARSSPKIKKQIEIEAKKNLKEIDIEAICDDVYLALDGIDVEEFWDRSGSTRHGYSAPEDMAVEMIEEELMPYNEEVIRLFEMGMTREAKLYCMGVLKGIYRYNQESKSEFKDWAEDVPGECFGYLLGAWRERTTDEDDIREMDEFIEKEMRKVGGG
ncbi:MAG: hypothetical protein WAX69_27150 [Victivallales bacterium]